jgi:peptidoglycan hydrolase FlgJ
MDNIKITQPAVQQKNTADISKSTDSELSEEQRSRLKKACADFESIFFYYMLKSMRNTVPKGGLMGNSPGKDTYTMMFDQKISEEMAKTNKGTGLQKVLYNQMVKAIKNNSSR